MVKQFTGIVIVAVIFRLLMVSLFVYPQANLASVGGGDGGGYHALAVSVLESNQYNASLFLARPPLFPTLIAALYKLSGSVNLWMVIAFNLMLSSLTAGLTYLFALRFKLDQKVAMIAGFLVGLDPTQGFYGVAPLTEALLGFLILATLIMVMRLWGFEKSNIQSTAMACFVGLLCGMTMLTKPVAIMFWIIPAGFMVIRRKWRETFIIILLSLVFLSGWTYHNWATFGVPSFSNTGVWNMLFARGGSVIRRVTHEPPSVVQKNLVLEIERRARAEGSETPSEFADMIERQVHPSRLIYYYLTYPDSKRYAIMTNMAIEIWLKYPAWSLIMTLVGILRMHLLPPRVLPFKAIWLIYYMVIYSLTIIGLVGLKRRKIQTYRNLFFTIIGVWVYFTFITVVSMTSALDTRMQMPFFPLLSIAVAYALTNEFSQLSNGKTIVLKM